ncbi:MAG: NAD(FAD)-utilizing dehydrogenase [Gammaproteobacteria bacterium RIFCSPHIGHO2_12_FULL_63_22]|nr:MAG: NAD(FAD)-utilizing dehydrogenase [Gammaproteobacteria bacterium RIFCSPHIGHO2_12_FULL_63_22]
MAAEAALDAGQPVDLFEAKGSVGRKFLIAGKGGLNLTHSESPDRFHGRYGARAGVVAGWLHQFDNDALREWARSLGVETFVGSSGRVFPADMKAAPLLRAWVRRLREGGVRFHVRHRCTGFDAGGALVFETPEGALRVHAGATVLALGGGSWPQLGSDGAWTQWLAAQGVQVHPLTPANCGFDIPWTEHFSSRHAGAPVKPAWLSLTVGDADTVRRQGEFVITATGIEGSLVYALSGRIRDALARHEPFRLELDLAPEKSIAWVRQQLSLPSKGRSLSEQLRRRLGISGVEAALLHEIVPRPDMKDPAVLAQWIKALPLQPLRPRPIEEAISSAGGVSIEALDPGLMSRNIPGLFCAGEMLDWEAPTGGYLLAASFASGRRAGENAAKWISEKSSRA